MLAVARCARVLWLLSAVGDALCCSVSACVLDTSAAADVPVVRLVPVPIEPSMLNAVVRAVSGWSFARGEGGGGKS